MASGNPKLRKALAPMLESIDTVLSERGMELQSRPFEAASTLVRHSLIEVKGDDDKDDFAGKPWFAAIYAEIYGWYKNKYGALMKVQPDKILGLVAHNGMPHIIHLPITISQLQDDGLLKLTFPTEVCSSEDPMSWVKPRIRKNSIAGSRVKLHSRVQKTCSMLRQIGINTGSAGGKESKVPLMARSILEHLGLAATTVDSRHKERNSLAIWELHMACEKALKSLLSQREIQFPKMHNLAKLNKLLNDPVLEQRARRMIDRLPNDNAAIDHRYLDAPQVTINVFYVYYFISLQLCVLYTSHLRQAIKIGGASIFLRRPPWLSQLQ